MQQVNTHGSACERFRDALSGRASFFAGFAKPSRHVFLGMWPGAPQYLTNGFEQSFLGRYPQKDIALPC